MSGGVRIFSSVAIAIAVAMVLCLFASMTGAPAMADESALAPKPAKGAGEACVADTDFMRRNHMKMLMHQRDDTVHEGIRTKQFSLKGCIECHAVKGEDAKPVAVTDERHFCRTCHDYAAVRVDCFECHSSVPEEKDTAATPTGDSVAALGQYLEGREQ